MVYRKRNWKSSFRSGHKPWNRGVKHRKCRKVYAEATKTVRLSEDMDRKVRSIGQSGVQPLPKGCGVQYRLLRPRKVDTFTEETHVQNER